MKITLILRIFEQQVLEGIVVARRIMFFKDRTMLAFDLTDEQERALSEYPAGEVKCKLGHGLYQVASDSPSWGNAWEQLVEEDTPKE